MQILKSMDISTSDVGTSRTHTADTTFDRQTMTFYTTCAEVYEYLYPDHLKYSRRLFNLLAPRLKHAGVRSILDASCGVGHDMSCLLQHGFEVDGADANEHMIEEARRRLSSSVSSRFLQKDARDLTQYSFDKKFDCVVFRGNTLSNIRPSEIHLIVHALRSLLNDNGILIIDFRDGHRQITDHKTLEFRGAGYDSVKRTCYFSFYSLKHAQIVTDPYQVTANVLLFDLRHLMSPLRRIAFTIRSHYVIREQVLESLTNDFKSTEIVHMRSIGLPHLETVIASGPKIKRCSDGA